jgi:hypothetical protein
MRNVVLLWVLLAGCAGEEKSPLPYYGVPAGSSGAAGAGGVAGAGGQAGAGAQGGASGAVVINEVDPSGDPADWVELFNRGAEPVDLSGWNVVQEYEGAPPEDKDRLEIPAGTVLPPGERLVLFTRRSDGPGPGDFGIGKDAPERLTLLSAGGQVVDDTTTDGAMDAPLEAGVSWCRLPDGQGDFRRCTSTRGTSNQP